MVKGLLSRLFGKAEPSGPVEQPSVEYKGYRITPSPYPSNGQYQTAGVIRSLAEPAREHRFIRAETHPSIDAAASFAVIKAKQIIDEQGDSLFRD
ncbi:HlyU family transcriptional regulator [Microvirga massiliensis]|uniref:HlyU family transcriptional regulator n=1 Tax=Microvirga massiliensis TaxID=1033741 RepID=UPI00062B6406|nr:HlyU family transcriptional regulator [Microvirga massiliensis]